MLSLNNSRCSDGFTAKYSKVQSTGSSVEICSSTVTLSVGSLITQFLPHEFLANCQHVSSAVLETALHCVAGGPGLLLPQYLRPDPPRYGGDPEGSLYRPGGISSTSTPSPPLAPGNLHLIRGLESNRRAEPVQVVSRRCRQDDTSSLQEVHRGAGASRAGGRHSPLYPPVHRR